MKMDLHIADGRPPPKQFMRREVKSFDAGASSGNQIFLQIGSVTELEDRNQSGVVLGEAAANASEPSLGSSNVHLQELAAELEQAPPMQLEDASQIQTSGGDNTSSSFVVFKNSEKSDPNVAGLVRAEPITSMSAAEAGERDQTELSVCLMSIVVLLGVFVCMTRAAASLPFMRCLAVRRVVSHLLPSDAEADVVKAEVSEESMELTEAPTTLSAVPKIDAEPPDPRPPECQSEGSSEGQNIEPPLAADDALRARVSKIPIAAMDEVLAKSQAGAHAGGYDCAILRPLVLCPVLRVQATVLGSTNGMLLTPLTLKPCVLYQAIVSRRLHSGMPPVPVAYASMSSSFHVALCDTPDVQVEVEGDQVMLLGMLGGQFSYTGLFNNAPEQLQDFALTHRSAVPGGQWQTSLSLRSEADSLEFQECALLTGSKVTLVGELIRHAGGALALRPVELELMELAAAPRVLVSDDPDL
jgi:hypothetical protein